MLLLFLSASKCENVKLISLSHIGYNIRLSTRALEKLNISANMLFAEGSKALAEALKDNTIMKELNIAENSLGYDSDGNTDMSGVIAISDAIPTMGALMSLNISTNSFGRHWDEQQYNWISDMTGIKALAAAIPVCK